MAKKLKSLRAGAKYRVVFSRDESGWWQARVPQVRGCHTQGRTVEEARRRIREALSLFVEDAEGATLVDDIRMPIAAKRAVREYRALRTRVEQDEREASLAARAAVKILRSTPGLRLSLRDAAGVLGVSYQRVHQLTSRAAEPRARADDRRRR